MKICVISSSVFVLTPPHGISGYGGLEVIAYQCAKGLAERGHQVTLIAPLGSQCPGVDVVQCLPPGMSEEAAWKGCVWKNANGEDVHWPGYWQKLLEFNTPDSCIIAHDWNKWAYMLKAEGQLKCPILGVTHAPVHTMFQSPPPVEKPCIVCISEDQRAHYEALFSPAQARTAYNGICTKTYAPLKLPRTKRYLFLARFSSVKSPDLAIEACKKAGVGLDLIGDTSITQEPELFHRCMAMADGEQIRVWGAVPRGEAVWWYSQAHALLHPTKFFREPMGLGPVEAQACGCPVISWDFGALKETVKHGETGFRVNALDEMVQLLKTDAVATLDRGKCQEWARTFSLERMTARYEELCQEALRTGGW